MSRFDTRHGRTDRPSADDDQAIVRAQIDQKRYGALLRSIAGVLFLGAPFRGSSMQPLAALLARIVAPIGYAKHSEVLQWLSPESVPIKDLLHDFLLVVNNRSIPLVCFHELLDSKIPKVPSQKAMIVDEFSAGIPGFPHVQLACDHSNLNKHSHCDAPNYRLIVSELRKLADGSHARIKSRSTPVEVTNGATDISDVAVKDCLRKIWVTDPYMDMAKIKQRKEDPIDEVGSWIMSDLTYTRWLNDQDSQALWICGTAGKGKTMLSIVVIEQLLERCKLSGQASSTVLCYFFFDHQFAARQTPASLLRTLIWQLICQHPSCATVLISEFQSKGETWLSDSDPYGELWTIFIETIQRNESIESLLIVIDALDECQSESRDALIKSFKSLLTTDKATINPLRRVKVRILITSRPETSLTTHWPDLIFIDLDSSEASIAAVKTYVGLKVDELFKDKGLKEELVQDISRELFAKAEGTFLWVSLTCQALAHELRLRTKAKEILKKFPKGLQDLYRRLLAQVLFESEDEDLEDGAQTDAKFSASILRAVLLAVRPLRLEELAILAELPLEHRDERKAISEYVSLCYSFLIVKDSVVTLVHQTAQEFLRKESTGLLDPANEEKLHLRYAINCLDHAWSSRDVLAAMAHDAARFRLYDPDKFTTHEYQVLYPYVHWTGHLSDVSASADCEGHPILNKVETDEDFLSHLIVVYNAPLVSRTPDWRSWNLLHFAAHSGLALIVQNYCRSPLMSATLINAPTSNGDTALYIAAKNGQTGVVQPLLDAGADVNAQGSEYGNALQAASRHGNEVVVKLLLDAGADVNALGRNFGNALQVASCHSNEVVVKLLLDAGADINAQGGNYGNALQVASSHGNEVVVKLLLDTGADVNAQGGEYGNALQLASRHGNEVVVKLLLDAGANANA